MPASEQFSGFDPDFDDTTWNDAWVNIPIVQVPPGVHSSGYRVERKLLDAVEIFGKPYRLAAPFDCRLLFDPEGEMWMSTTPQEHIMMANNAARSRGHVLVGGLGLGLYPQYAAQGAIGQAHRFTMIEHSAVVEAIVAPSLTSALNVPIEVRVGAIESVLAGPIRTRYDTIFLDTWPSLDATFLPQINWLRQQAMRHLAPDGEVLLWGYQWMVRLFLDACHQVLALPARARQEKLAGLAQDSPGVFDLLEPAVTAYHGADVSDMVKALERCRAYILSATKQP